jgi:hypothetical protein
VQPMSRWILDRARRSEVERIVFRLSEALLEEFGPIDLGDDVLPGEEQRWELAVDLDWLQANFAGSLFWKLNVEGRARRKDTLDEIEMLVPRAEALHLVRTVDRLHEIAAALRSMH